MARSCEDLAGDRLALRAVLAFTAIGGPLQAFAVARLRGLDAWHTTLQPVLMARLGQAAVLVLLLCVLQDRWYSARRTAALTAANVALWALQLEGNRQLLLLSGAAEPLATGLIAAGVGQVAALHAVLLPLVRGHLLPDAAAALLAILAHAAWTPCDSFGACWFVLTAAGSAVSLGVLVGTAQAQMVGARRAMYQLEAVFEHGLDGKCLLLPHDSGDPVIIRASSGWVEMVAPDTAVRLRDPTYLPSILSADNMTIVRKSCALVQTQGAFECTIHHRGSWLRCRGHAIATGECFLSIADVTTAHEAIREKAALTAEKTALAKLDLSFDLVAQLEVKDGVSTRLWSSKSHLTVLGHDPDSCNGDQSTLSHLYPAEFTRDQLPGLIEAFERGDIADGLMGEHCLLHADGHSMMFEWRLDRDTYNSARFIVVWRDITERRVHELLEREKEVLMQRRGDDADTPLHSRCP